jgi:hypothetical protein
VSGFFDNPYHLARALEPWHGQASIYVTINRLDPALLARARNRLVPFAKITTAAEDVTARQWFAVDVDSARPRGVPATDAELATALGRRDEIVQFLADTAGFPDPLRIMSGNGGWALWRVDLPNVEEVSILYQHALKALDQRFSDGAAKADLAVHSAAQLTKLCTTIAVTGDAIPERPHRRVITQGIPLHLLANPQLVTSDQLRSLASLVQSTSRPTYSFPRGAETPNLIELFKARGLYLRKLTDPRHAVICPWADEHSVDHGPDDTSTVLFEPSEGRAWGFKCLHAHCTERTITDVLRKLGIGVPDSLLSLKGELEKERIFDPKGLRDLLTDRTPTINWVLQWYLPEGGLILLVAYPKVGKSTFAYYLVIAVARGEPFLGFATRQGAVLILAVEEHPRDVKVRLLKLGARPEDPIHVHVGPLDSNARTFSALTDFIRKEHIRLVVLDTLAQFWQISRRLRAPRSRGPSALARPSAGRQFVPTYPSKCRSLRRHTPPTDPRADRLHVPGPGHPGRCGPRGSR